MSREKKNIVSRWFKALLTAGGRLIWVLILIIVLAALGRYAGMSGKTDPELSQPVKKTITPPTAWKEVDRAVVETLVTTREMTAAFAGQKLDSWFQELMGRVDSDFLDWYFSYWTQQLLGLEGLYQLGLSSFFANQQTAALKLTEEIQAEFAKRVLRPQIAELVLERIVRETVAYYVAELDRRLNLIPTSYQIPQPDWDRYLQGIAITVSGTDGGRRTSLTLKGLTTATAGTSILLVGKMKFLVSKLSGKVLAKSAGKAAAKIAAKTGAKVAAKTGGKFLGPIVGIGVLVWDLWDHNATKKENRPILRRSIADYFGELREILLYDQEAGMMTIFNDLENQIASHLIRAGRAPEKSFPAAP